MLKKNIRWDKEKICEEIRTLKTNGVSLTPGDVRRVNPRLFNAAIRKKHFGHWKAALEGCGLDPGEEYRNARKRRKKEESWGADRILGFLRAKGPSELSRVYRDEPRLYSSARRIFGSWKEALRAAGQEETLNRFKEDELLNMIRRYLENPLRTSVSKDDPTLYARAYRRFGSWKRAVEQARGKGRDEN